MTRKSHKGIVGKAMPTLKDRYDVGVGIDFVGEGLKSGPEIDKTVRKRKNEQNQIK